MLLKQFHASVENVLANYGYKIDDIDYINLDETYSITPQIFFGLDAFPSVVENKFEKVSWCNSWYVPYSFRIVMKDNSWFLYNVVSDEFYNSWVHVKAPTRSPIQITL